MAAALTISPADHLEELRLDRTHGGSWLARLAVETLVREAAAPAATAAELRERLVTLARELAATRPEAGSVAAACARLVAGAHRAWELSPNELRRLVLEEGRALLEQRDRAARSIAIQLKPRLEGATVLTHSASATVREAVVYTPPARVICTVSRPLEEGRAFADELAEHELEVELVEDEDSPRRAAGASLVLVGADTIFRDGTLANRRGTRAIAESAVAAGVPVVVASESIKLAPFDPPGEPMDPSGSELIPPELITEFATEEGPFTPDEVAMLVDRTPFLQAGYELLRGGGA